MNSLLLLATALLVQEPAQIRVTTRMVEVAVTVQDARGRPVAGLRVEDFQLLDGGREETIRSFSAFGPERRKAPGEARVATVILMDYLNSLFRDESLARVQLLRLLREMEPNHRVALVALDVGFQVLHDFTTDAGSLLAALEAYRPYRPMYAAALPPPPFLGRRSRYKPGLSPAAQSEGMMEKLDRQAEATYAVVRAKNTDSATAALAAWLARTPGRKNLLWVSSVFPGALAAHVRSDDVAVYPIDVRCPLEPTQSARMLAERTGGAAFDHGNDLLGAMRKSVEEGDSVYVLGYYPSHETWDGRFRHIQAVVNRPDLVVRHREGYVAALEDTFKPPDVRDTLMGVAAAAADVRGIGVMAKAGRRKGGEVELWLQADWPGPGPAVGEDLEAMAVPVLDSGELGEAEMFRLKAAGGQRQQAGLTVSAPAVAPKLRIVLRQPRTGALGSATVTLRPER